MWLLSGIFRSVSLRSEAAVSLWDAELKTKLSDGYTKAELVIELTLKNSAAGSADVALEAQLFDGSGLSVFSVPVTASAQVEGSKKMTLCAIVEHPQLWTAESPALYT